MDWKTILPDVTSPSGVTHDHTWPCQHPTCSHYRNGGETVTPMEMHGVADNGPSPEGPGDMTLNVLWGPRAEEGHQEKQTQEMYGF